MPSFQEILNTKSEDIKPPKPLPIGTYLAIIDGQPEFKQMGEKQNWGAIFKLKPVQAQPDVDQAALLESLDGKSLTEFTINHTFWVTDDARHRLNDFLVNDLGIVQSGRTLGELIPESQGKQVFISLTHTPSKDNKLMYANVKSFARV